MSLFLRDYLTIVWFGLAAVLLAGLLLGVASVVRPSRPSKAKLTAYESGVDPVGHGWSQSQVRYYVFALLFVIFEKAPGGVLDKSRAAGAAAPAAPASACA